MIDYKAIYDDLKNKKPASEDSEKADEKSNETDKDKTETKTTEKNNITEPSTNAKDDKPKKEVKFL